MNQAILQAIKYEIEKIEQFPGFGEVRVTIVNGHANYIFPTPAIQIQKDILDKCPKEGVYIK